LTFTIPILFNLFVQPCYYPLDGGASAALLQMFGVSSRNAAITLCVVSVPIILFLIGYGIYGLTVTANIQGASGALSLMCAVWMMWSAYKLISRIRDKKIASKTSTSLK
jgi:hypothetical protein